MNDLPEQFPPQQVSGEVLSRIAERARQKHLSAPIGTPAQEPARHSVSPFIVSIQHWMRGAGLGVLDIAVVAALLCLSVSLAWMYVIGPSSHKSATDSRQLASAGDRDSKKSNIQPPSPAPKTIQGKYAVAGDGAEATKTPDPVVPPKPEPAPKPAKSAEPSVSVPPEDVDVTIDRRPPGDDVTKLIPSNGIKPRSQILVDDIPHVGSGSLGNRNGGGRKLAVKKFGGSRASEESVDLALRWLAFHQEADGHWDALKYGSGQKTDTAVTALSLLAFLAAGHTEKVGMYKDNVIRAVNWLKSKQDREGLIDDLTDAGAHRGIGYPHGIATTALAEAAGMARVPDTVAAAQKAIDYCVNVQQHRRGDGKRLGWRYVPNTPGDICVSTWYVSALKSAKVASLNVNHEAFDGALEFLDSVEIKEEGKPSRYAYMPGSEANRRRNAMGNYCRQFLGWTAADLQPSVEAFVNAGGVPTWGANGESVDFYYWYYGSLCTFQQGGEVWKRWNEGLKKALEENQCRQGDDAGSWPVVGDFSSEWGRVGQTAFGALCSEVYYRYAMMTNPARVVAAATAPDDDPAILPKLEEQPLLGTKLKTKVTFNLVGKSLPDAVALLNQLTDVKIWIDPKLDVGQTMVTLRVSEMPLDEALDWMLKLCDLDRQEDHGSVLIVRKKAVAPPKPQSKPTPPQKDEF